MSPLVMRLFGWLLTGQIKASIHVQTRSEDPIGCFLKPVERTNEIAYRIRVSTATDRIVGLSLIGIEGGLRYIDETN